MAETPTPPIQFAEARNVRLAYQVFGDGPHDIVAIPPTAQNIELSWERQEITAMFDRFARFSRYVHFDKRGTGCSGRTTDAVNSIDERVDDVRAVMDAAGVQSAHFFAASEGGPMAILFALAFPDRVRSLTLFGAFANLFPDGLSEAEHNALVDRQHHFAAMWGTPESPFLAHLSPTMAASSDFSTWYQRYERNAASPESLATLMVWSIDIDVREALSALDMPVLVIHRKGDLMVDFAHGEHLAREIPGATLFAQEGADHLAFAGDMDEWMDEFERFVTGSVAQRPDVVDHKVRIVTLGRFAVEVDGSEVPTSAWGSRRARQLCKRLVAARGWPVTRDELLEILWPDGWDTRKLGARLSVQLSGVRRVLDGGVSSDRQTVSLNLSEVSTDLTDFFDAEVDDEIVDLYTGEFLPGDVYDDWTTPIRNGVRSRFTLAARRVAEANIVANPARAVDVAHKLVAADTYDGEARRTLVRALVAAGERREAERAHADWERVFTEMGFDTPPFEGLATGT